MAADAAPTATAAATDEFNLAKNNLLATDAEGYSVYEHFCNMVATVMERNPGNVARTVSRLPEQSRHIKGTRFKQQNAAGRAPPPPPYEADRRVLARAREERALFRRRAGDAETDIARPTPFTTVTTTTTTPPTVPEFRPLTEDQAFHALCGVGMPRREYTLLEESMARLVAEKGLKDVQCFGRIFGTEQNYTVVRSRRWLPGPDDKLYAERYAAVKPPRKGLEVPVPPEPPGVGLNRYTFWVCEHAGGPWVPLPDVTPEQVAVARRIRKYFTGRLDAAVRCHPPFPGTEANYLRAQLARITAAASIAPEGEVELFEAEDDDEEPEEDDDGAAAAAAPKEVKFRPLLAAAKPVPVDEGIEAYASRKRWVHTGLFIRKNGRGAALPPKPEPGEDGGEEEDDAGEDGEDDEAAAAAAAAMEAAKDLLGGISGDGRYAAIKVPKEPKEPEEGAEEGGEGEGGEGDGEEEEDAEKEGEEEEGEDEEEEGSNPNKITLRAWRVACVNALCRKHGVVTVKSLRWPGAAAWLSSGQTSGSVYFGDGLKSTDAAFSPCVPPPVQSEVPDLVEEADPTSMMEKLILRGEEPKEEDSEDEKDEEDEAADE